MNWIVLLILLEIIIFVSAMLAFQCDVLSPSVIVSFVFLVSTLILVTNYHEWGVCISLRTCFVIATALISFLMIGLFYSKINSSTRQTSGIKVRIITVSNYKIIFSLIFELATVYLYYKEVVRIASYITKDWGMGLIWKYRQAAFYTDTLIRNQAMSTLATQGYKITMIIAHIMLYIFISNVVMNKSKIVPNLKYLILIPAYILMTTLSGNRLALLNMTFFGITVWYILKMIKVRSSIRELMSFILKFLGIAVLIIVVFWLLTSVVQRYTKLPFWTTISIYAGAPIQLLNEYIKNPVEVNQVFGQESLINIHNSLYKLGLSNYRRIINLEYRTYNGANIGNVYTALRRLIQDYGYVGMLLCVSLISTFYNWLYYKKVRQIKQINYQSIMRIILYAFMSYPLFLFSIEQYFTLMWSFGYLLTIVLFYVLFYFYTRVSFVGFKIRLRKTVFY